MTLRHAATLALVGWYLMISPTGDLAFSTSTWKKVGSYDTATECEIASKQFREAFATSGATIMNDEIATRKHAHDSGLDYFSLPRCIATDDPRLKEK